MSCDKGGRQGPHSGELPGFFSPADADHFLLTVQQGLQRHTPRLGVLLWGKHEGAPRVLLCQVLLLDAPITPGSATVASSWRGVAAWHVALCQALEPPRRHVKTRS